MATGPSSDLGWVQLVFGSVITLGLAIGGGAFRHLSAEIEKLKTMLDSVARGSSDRMERGDGQIWETIEKLREEITADRREQAVHRAEIAGAMVTREELERQITRLLDVLRPDRRG